MLETCFWVDRFGRRLGEAWKGLLMLGTLSTSTKANNYRSETSCMAAPEIQHTPQAYLEPSSAGSRLCADMESGVRTSEDCRGK